MTMSAGEEHVELGVVGEALGKPDGEDTADDGADDGADAAHDGGGDDVDGPRDGERTVRRDDAEAQGLESADHADQERRDDPHPQLGPERGHPDLLGRVLVVAQGAQAQAETGAQHDPDDDRGDDREREGVGIQGGDLRGVLGEEQAGRTAETVPVDHEHVHGLSEDQCRDGEVQPAKAEHRHAEDDREHGGGKAAAENEQRQWPAQVAADHGSRVRADTYGHGRSERDQAAIAGEDVPGLRQGHQHEHLVDDERVVAADVRREQRQHDHRDDDRGQRHQDSLRAEGDEKGPHQLPSTAAEEALWPDGQDDQNDDGADEDAPAVADEGGADALYDAERQAADERALDAARCRRARRRRTL